MKPTSEIYLGTIALEPARWARGADAPALITLSTWLDAIGDAGFDGIELWERHVTEADDAEARAVLGHDVGVPVFNTYVSLDDPDASAREAVAAWVDRADSKGVKFNVGNEPDAVRTYAQRIADWIDVLPARTALLCECHHGISIAEDPLVAADIFDAAGPVDRVQAIVHTHEDPDQLRARFDAYGERITHVHVNFIDFDTLRAPRLDAIAERLATKVALLDTLGFAGTWTIEFVHGIRTEDDRPDALMTQAADDLGVLRKVLT